MSKNLPQIIKDVGFDFSWSEEKVWKLDIPASEMDIKRLIWHFDLPFLSKNGQSYCLKPWDIINDPQKYQEEYKRTMQADLKYPLDVMENKRKLLMLDGLHRLMKAYIQGLNFVNVRIIPRSMINDILR